MDEKRYISVVCGSCRQEIEVPAEAAGQQIECPACGAKIAVAENQDGPTAAQLEAMKSRTIRIELSDL